ncbi:YceD family protein [Croceicoccus marinus]|jgi:uncharacterized metal-binding protein YceD (DUF177 family)|uniref:DUF177 domain-containing protein n=1 Tax=Croceicoccus marinus TaxID=450378 RepID=A0A7G6VSM9_9SPHN|nr:DUF177 domain-containing protein [Croceicoccus marinus]QNE04744.1 DUF177 domain-containing protein [Croceicoccus marinus]
MSDLPGSELTRWIAVRQCDGRAAEITANEAERAALAERFSLVSIGSLSATLNLSRDGEKVAASGHMQAAIVQSCAISGNDLPARIEEELELLFVPARNDFRPDEEIELEESDLDEIAYEGDRFDLGEAVAQSLALAIDPFATGPEADRVREEVGLAEPEKENPFAKLKGLGLN